MGSVVSVEAAVCFAFSDLVGGWSGGGVGVGGGH